MPEPDATTALVPDDEGTGATTTSTTTTTTTTTFPTPTTPEAAMGRNVALEALPSPYGMALRLRDGGETVVGIADATGVPVDAVPALLEVGDRKLAALLDHDSEPGH